MNPRHPPTTDDTSQHALADGRLPPGEAGRLSAGLDAEARERVDAWERQRMLLSGLHDDWLERPMTHPLLQSADHLAQAYARQRRWTAWGGAAAAWLLAFGLGWGLHGRWMDGTFLASADPASSMLFVHQAAVAYAVYQPDLRHPVEVTAAQQDHLVQWLSKRLARPITVPHLQDLGFELMGGRLLPGGNGARAQFMYQDANGARVTLYLGALDATLAPDAGSSVAAFQFRTEGAVSSFYWIDHGFGYALSGELPRQALQALATDAYHQISTAQPARGNAPRHDS